LLRGLPLSIIPQIGQPKIPFKKTENFSCLFSTRANESSKNCVLIIRSFRNVSQEDKGIKMKLSDDFKRALRHFAYYYTNGTLPYVIGDEKLLEGIDYREMLKTEASLVETVHAIYSNNIKMDENGNVLNQTHAMKRAAQWIRLVCRGKNEEYKVEPEFEDWETHLY